MFILGPKILRRPRLTIADSKVKQRWQLMGTDGYGCLLLMLFTKRLLVEAGPLGPEGFGCL